MRARPQGRRVCAHTRDDVWVVSGSLSEGQGAGRRQRGASRARISRLLGEGESIGEGGEEGGGVRVGVARAAGRSEEAAAASGSKKIGAHGEFPSGGAALPSMSLIPVASEEKRLVITLLGDKPRREATVS